MTVKVHVLTVFFAKDRWWQRCAEKKVTFFTLFDHTASLLHTFFTFPSIFFGGGGGGKKWRHVATWPHMKYDCAIATLKRYRSSRYDAELGVIDCQDGTFANISTMYSFYISKRLTWFKDSSTVTSTSPRFPLLFLSCSCRMCGVSSPMTTRRF